MPVEVIDKIKQKNNNTFKLMDSEDVEYENPAMNASSDVPIDSVQGAIDYMFNIINAAPVLSYAEEDGFREGEKKYYSLGEQMRLVFNFTSSASGKVTITILRNGFTFRTVTTNKGRIVIDLGQANQSANYVYTVTAIDGLGRDSTTTLTFNQILGGVELSSTFDYIIQNKVFIYGDTNDITVPAAISYAESGYERVINYAITGNGETVVSGQYNCGTENWSSSFILEHVSFPSDGNYTLTLQGAVDTGTSTLVSNVLLYNFAVINMNTIAVSLVSINDISEITTNDNVVISYRIVTDISALTIPNALSARCNLYRVDGENLITVKTIRVPNASTGDTISWAIGRLSTEGEYRYEIIGEPTGGATSNINYQKLEGSFEVIYQAGIGADYERQNLLAYFDANDMDNNDPDPSKWKMKNAGSNNYFYIKLHDLNYKKNGWIVDETDGSKMLKFTGDSYGELRYVNAAGSDVAFSPMSEMTSAAMGNTLEMVFRTRCVGVMDSCVMSCRNNQIENYGGYSINYNGENFVAKISSNEQAATTPILEDKFVHVAFVIDKNIRRIGVEVDNTNIENANTVRTMNIYVNGVRTKVIGVNDNENFANTNAFPSMQMLINAYQDVINSQITGFGKSEIKMIRMYNAALTASQVLGNYINSKYDLTEREKLINKNDQNRADIPIVRFVRNKVINGRNVRFSKYSVDKSFEVLNAITLKKSDDPTIATSKNSWVNCTMWYTYIDNDGIWRTVSYNDVDVYLQGTSSLQYPIKNYKIKIFNSSLIPTEDGNYVRGKKLKIIPPNKSDKDGWHLADSTFTLKCDYMEQSHKNNTPTAMLYEEILDNVVTSVNGTYTPAKQDSFADCYVTYEDENGVEVTKRKYRDAVAGFPILLYYNENNDYDEAGNPIDYNTLSNADDGYYVNSSDVMVGTQMFNVDKTGKSIGFEIPVEEYQVTSPTTGEQITYDGTENPFMVSIRPCVSLEGSSNSAKPSAASFYTMDEANRYTYEDDYLKPQFNVNHESLGIADYAEFYEKVQNGTLSNFYSYEQYLTLSGTGIFKDIYKYIEATFEIRWAYTDEVIADDESLSKKDYNDLTYGHLIETINWLDTAYQDRDKFRSEFSQHFNLAYSVTYYLQMMMFIQVDNAGKNAMFDEWGDGIWHPRPYDMDTQMGENNSGDDVIHVSAEINPELSPAGITGSMANQANASNKDTDRNHTRYIDYNTPNSKLWIAFGRYFRPEIVAAYTKLRNDKVYDTKHIVETVNALTSDIIGESFYNKDAGAKYMSQTYYEMLGNGSSSINDAMLTKLQGNRDNRYEQMFDQRIIFLDTFFGYTSGDTLNTSLTIRSDAVSAGNSNVPIGISVYSPCYITIAVGTDVTIVAYIDTSETYEYAGNVYEGVLFNLPIIANNKDITILGSGNIKSINHMENLVVTNFICSNAKKLTQIVITNSTALASLSLGANTYLRTLNLHGSTTVSGNLNLENCENMKYIDITDTAITSISLPEGGNLEEFIAENCALTTVSFVDLQFLKTINVANCTDIVAYEMVDCPKITEVDTSGYINLNKLVLSSCDNVTSLNLSNTNLAEMSITSCDNIRSINLSGCNGSIMRELNLSTVYNLNTLNLNNAQPADGIVLSLPLYKKEYAALTGAEIQRLINDGVDVYWHELTSLSANSSSLKNIAHGIQTGLVAGTCDFGQLTNLTSLNIQNNQKIFKIENLTYRGNVVNLFYNCTKLQSISGEITSVGTSANQIFMYDAELTDISNLVTNFDSITSATYLFWNCAKLSYAAIKQLLYTMPNVTNLYGFMVGCSSVTAVDNELFTGTPKVNTLQYAFVNTKITSIPSGFFEPIKDSIVTLYETFYNMTELTTVPNDIIKNCTKITNTNGLFRNCTKLVNLFNGSYSFDIFPTNSKVTTTVGMFDSCTALKVGSYATGHASNGLKKMFDNLPELLTAGAMFYNTTFITTLPETIFANTKKLQSIDAMFAQNTNMTALPAALFSSGNVSTTTHPSLTSARGLFSGCAKIGGVIQNTLLGGATALTNIGHINNFNFGNGPRRIYSGGMFANTGVIGYAYDFLHHLKNLISVSMLFYKGSCTSSSMVVSSSGNNNGALAYVYIGAESYPNKLYNDIFKGLTKLQDVRYCFAGNNGFATFVATNGEDVNSPTLFADCKSALRNAEGLFSKCTNLAIPVPENLFKDCRLLTNLRACFADCIHLNGTLPEDFLSGCSAVQNTSYMFYRCSELGMDDAANDISVPSGIFDSCRNTINNVSNMFAGCGFTGKIGIGSAERIVSETGVTTYRIIKHGLLSECTRLTNASSMFRSCKKLKGAIPEDIFFTADAQNLYASLTDISNMFDNCEYLGMSSTENSIDGRNKQIVYGDDILAGNSGYLIPQNWLTRCPALINITRLFNRVSCPYDPNAQYYAEQMLMSDTTFNQQTHLQDVSYSFAHVKALHASLTAVFMQNSLNTITNAEGIFCFSNLHQAGAQQFNAVFEKNTSQTARNTILRNIKNAFHNTYSNNMTGYGPSQSKFTALENSNGMVYNQTKLSNFATYTENQKAFQSIWDTSHTYTVPEFAVAAGIS